MFKQESIMKSIKIKPTSADKVQGRFVKYRKGDCLSIKCENGKYLAALITDKFNKYYDFTLLQYHKSENPDVNIFNNGKFLGTRFGSWEEIEYAVDKRMIECKYVDNNNNINLVCTLKLIDNIVKASYAYVNTINDLEEFYLSEIPIRIEKTNNADMYPELAFVGRHLVDISCLIDN